MDKISLPDKPVDEGRLSFVPVKNSGRRSFSLALEDGVLYLITAGKKYRITLTEEE